MQATPAPSSPPRSPVNIEPPVEAAKYPSPPQNTSSAPFGVLVGLFEKLQAERKHDRRRKLIDAWFTVRHPPAYSVTEIYGMLSIGGKRKAMTYILFYVFSFLRYL